jgi:hypothetical protein
MKLKTTPSAMFCDKKLRDGKLNPYHILQLLNDLNSIIERSNSMLAKKDLGSTYYSEMSVLQNVFPSEYEIGLKCVFWGYQRKNVRLFVDAWFIDPLGELEIDEEDFYVFSAMKRNHKEVTSLAHFCHGLLGDEQTLNEKLNEIVDRIAADFVKIEPKPKKNFFRDLWNKLG